MIVVDTNVIASLYLTSERSVEVEQALLKDPEWAAPALWHSELRNVLATHMRRGLLTLDDAGIVMSEAEALLQEREYDVESPDVLGLAKASGCSAYDCEFVSLALRLGVPLITSNKGVLSRFRGLAVSLADFAAG